jgi:Domain of unknown function (DUF4386)
MTIDRIDNSQHTAAKVAGWSGLLTFAIVVFGNYVLLNPLMVSGNAAATAQNVVTHQTQLRIAVVCFGIISSAWCVLCAFVFLIFPNFNKIVNDYIFDSPMALFELGVSVWILFKGLPSTIASIPHHAPN